MLPCVVLRSSGIEKIHVEFHLALQNRQISELMMRVNDSLVAVVDEVDDHSEGRSPGVRGRSPLQCQTHALILILAHVTVETWRTEAGGRGQVSVVIQPDS